MESNHERLVGVEELSERLETNETKREENECGVERRGGSVGARSGFGHGRATAHLAEAKQVPSDSNTYKIDGNDV